MKHPIYSLRFRLILLVLLAVGPAIGLAIYTGMQQRQTERVRLLHEEDLAGGFGEVYLSPILEIKNPNASCELIWQYLFPASKRSLDPRSLPSPSGRGAEGEGKIRRHHLDAIGLQRAAKKTAQKAGIQKRVSCHTLLHSFATHLLQNGYDIGTVQPPLAAGQGICSATKTSAPP